MMRHLWIVLPALVLLAPLSDGLGTALAAENRQTLDRQSDEKLSALAREYRIRVYLTFHQYRAEHDRRRAAWDQVEAAWKAAGSPADKYDTLVDWLSAAIQTSTRGSVGPLPEMPSFDRPVIKQPPVEQPPVKQPPVKQPPVKQPSMTLPGIEPPAAKPPVVERPSAEPRQAPVRYAAPKPLLPEPAALELDVGEQALPPDTARRPDVSADGPPAVEMPPVRDLARKLVDEQPSAPSLSSDLPTLEPRLPALELPQVAEEADSIANQPRRSDRPTPVGPDDTAKQRADVAKLPPVGPPDMGNRSVTAVAKKPPAAAIATNRPWAVGPNLVDRPAAPAARTTLEPTLPETPPVAETIDRPATEPSAEPVPLPPPPAKLDMPRGVNLRELAARIAGNNLAVRALESELDKGQIWTAEKLEPLLTRLRQLSVRTTDLQLYEGLVPEKDRWLVGEVESPRNLISQLASRIVEARSRAASDRFTGSDAQRAAELDALERLSRGLAKLARVK